MANVAVGDWRSGLTALLRDGIDAPQGFVREQAAVVRYRAIWLARFAAVATLLWIPVDMVRSDGAMLVAVTVLRVLLAAGLLTVAAATPRLPARTVVPLLLGTQAAAFAAMQWVQPPSDDFARSAYDLVPVLIAGQLAFFSRCRGCATSPMACPRSHSPRCPHSSATREARHSCTRASCSRASSAPEPGSGTCSSGCSSRCSARGSRPLSTA